MEDVVTLARANLLTMALVLSLAAWPAHSAVRVLIVSGLGGEADYEQKFENQAKGAAAAAAHTGAAQKDIVVLSGEQARRTHLDGELKKFASSVHGDDQVVVELIGHGSFDGEEYRFNLPGPDITGKEIVAFLDSMPASQILVVNATSSSGSVVESWRRANRVVITATRSGSERNATRFAEYWVQALSSAEADRDKNEIVTAAEAYDFASRKVADAFKSGASLATEHPRLDGKLADGSIDCCYAYAGGGGFSITNADSHEELMDELLEYPLSGFVQYETRPLVGLDHAFKRFIEAIERLAVPAA